MNNNDLELVIEPNSREHTVWEFIGDILLVGVDICIFILAVSIVISLMAAIGIILLYFFGNVI